jgi:hypothetical protein
MLDRIRDSCPLKRACTPPKKDDDMVPLGLTNNELDNELVALVFGSGKSRYTALKKILSNTLTKAYSVLKLTKVV